MRIKRQNCKIISLDMKILRIQIKITQAYLSGEGLSENNTDKSTVTIRAACIPEGPMSLLRISQEKCRLLF
jgi:hypothetical protein